MARKKKAPAAPVQQDEREIATTIAALRYWQRIVGDPMHVMPEYFEEHEPLDADEIDDLCERLNTWDDGPLAELAREAVRTWAGDSQNHADAISALADYLDERLDATRESGDPLTPDCEHSINEDCMNCRECGRCSESLNDSDVCSRCVRPKRKARSK